MCTFMINKKIVYSRGLLLLAAFHLFSPTLYPVVILVHGSFGVTQNWWRPGGDFFTELEAQAKILGHVVVPFCWSGKPTDYDITRGAEVLAKLVVSYPPQESIIFVGHSHGGNVINKATQLLFDPLPDILAQASSRPLADILATAQAQTTSNASVTQTYCPKANPNQHFYVLDFSPTLRQDRRYLIEKIYLLGTPVCVEKYHPQMQVVRCLINLFSEGDLIQPVLGLYQRQYPLHDRIANLEVSVQRDRECQLVNPGHSELHDRLIGRWLLYIPDLLQKQGLDNFECFSYGIDGHITCNENSHPHYKRCR